jgi:tRNA-dihydrouridine synthase A
MVTAGAALHGDRDRLLGFDPHEKPLAIQFGGSDPDALAQCALIAEDLDFDQINLNVGCPSDRVQQGRFGACLMAEPERVAECLASMSASVRLPVTVKCRLGIDNQDSYDDLARFIDIVSASGCATFIVHARKAWLSGLSPKENRDIPPLRYDLVARVKKDFPALRIVLNGGVQDLEQAAGHLNAVDGVMIGRAVYHNPYLLANADRVFYADDRSVLSRHEILNTFLPYLESQLARGIRLHTITRHILGLFYGVPGGRRWRRFLGEHSNKPGAGVDVVIQAAKLCSSEWCSGAMT